MEDSGNHSHTHMPNRMTARMGIALVLTLGFVVVEVLAGLRANSLALLSDAAHNVTDVIALGLSWVALKISFQPANDRKTFGYHRAGILVALANSTTLAVIAVGILVEAVRRLSQPAAVDSSLLIGVGTLAFAINAGTAWLVHSGSQNDVNLRSAYLHLMGDVLSTIGAVAAGIAIRFTGLYWLDPLVSFLIGGLILWNAWGIVRETVNILLEGTPRDIDMGKMVEAMEQIDGVQDVHDLHVWSITRSLRALSAHIVTDNISIREGASIQHNISDLVKSDYGIDHATLQLECSGCFSNDLYCGIGVLEEQPHEHAASH